MTRPHNNRASVHDESPPSLAVANPLCARDPALFTLCAEHRERCISLLLRMTAATDLHEPDLIGPPPHYSMHQVKSCAQVFDVLSKPTWTQYDLDRFEAYFPWAWRGELFGDCAEEARHRIRQAAEDAQAEIGVLREHSAVGGPRGMTANGL
jgi:hypothetical protein